MNAQRAERVVHVLSVAGIWVALLTSWGVRGKQMESYSAFGADLPVPTIWWLDFAGSWFALGIPAVCTVLVVWLAWRRSAHLTWVAGALLFAGLSYAVIGQTASVLPFFKACSAV